MQLNGIKCHLPDIKNRVERNVGLNGSDLLGLKDKPTNITLQLFSMSWSVDELEKSKGVEQIYPNSILVTELNERWSKFN